MNRQNPSMLLAIALFCRLNGIGRKEQSSLSDGRVAEIITEMQDVTEMMNEEVQDEKGLLEMAVKYALYKDAYEANRREEAQEYNRMYR